MGGVLGNLGLHTSIREPWVTYPTEPPSFKNPIKQLLDSPSSAVVKRLPDHAE